MSEITPSHRWLDAAAHIWPYLSGLFLTLAATVRLWWHGRQAIKKRIVTLETLAEHSVSHEDLQACRDDVRAADEKNLTLIFGEIRSLREEHNTDAKVNAQQHMDILSKMNGRS